VLAAAMPPEGAGVRELWGEIAALRSQQHLADGDADGTIAAAQRALDATPPHSFYIRSYALLYLAFGCQMAGDLPRAHAVLDAAAAEDGIPRELVLLRTIQLRSFVNLAAARPREVAATVPTMLRLATAGSLRTSIIWAHYFLGCAAYLLNDLGRAAEHFAAVTALADYAHTRAYVHSAIGLALAHQALGRPEAARAAVVAARELLARVQGQAALPLLDAFAAELAARQGRVEEALRWAARTRHALPEDATPLFYAPGLAVVRIYLWAGSGEQRDEALAGLARHAAGALRTHNVHLQIEAAALAAALHQAQGAAAEAVAALVRALALAAGGGVTRTFLDLAAELAPVCAALAVQQPPAGFAAEVGAAVKIEVERQSAAGKQGQAAPGGTGKAATAAAPGSGRAPGLGTANAAAAAAAGADVRALLTYRELDVLKLLCLRLTNKEIARELGISTETVRQHTVNLFRKLQVSNRRQAVVVARSLGYSDGA
jgi:LuxR family transcriptional regulator, maltose regulon positive regulatory protein